MKPIFRHYLDQEFDIRHYYKIHFDIYSNPNVYDTMDREFGKRSDIFNVIRTYVDLV